MKIASLTPKQIQVLQSIKSHSSSKHYSPTIKQLAESLTVSRTTAFGHVAELRKKGMLKQSTGRAHSLILTQSASRLLDEIEQEQDFIDYGNDSIPMLGRVAAGSPIEAISNEQQLSLTSYFGSTDNIFALEVAGDSMIDEDIRNGDYVICKKSQFANNGQLAIVIVDNDYATLKRFYKEKKAARLQPANKNYQPIYTDNCRIEAIVLGLVRRF